MLPTWITAKLAHRATLPIKNLAWLSLLFSQVTLADVWQPYQADYIAMRNGSKLGNASQTLQQEGENQYRLTYRSKASFLFLSDKRSEQSRFTLTDNQPVPLEYEFRRSGSGKEKSQHIRFDMAEQKAYVQDIAQPWQGELDNQLYQLSIGQALRAGDTTLTYQIIDQSGNNKQLQFRVEGEEQLHLPFGSLTAIKVARVREDSDRQTYLWFAPSLNYLMVRLQQFKQGKEQADLQLRRVQPDPAPVES